MLASGLAGAGDLVHVWCPSGGVSSHEDSGVIIHRELGRMTPVDLFKAGRMLDTFPGPRRLLLQWVPHAFGFRSANIPFSCWIWNRAFAHRDQVDVMIHEPYLPLRQEHFKHTALALAHRMMLAAVLRAAKRVWMAIPKWEEYCRPYALGRKVPFTWLPVVSNIPINHRRSGGQSVRARYAPSQELLIGHFGTCGGEIGTALRAVIPSILIRNPKTAVLVIGNGSEQCRSELLKDNPLLSNRVHSTGGLSDHEVSSYISACDLMFQPYPDGATSRRGSLMAALSHGKPVITTSGHLTEDLWQKSGSVVLVPAGNHPEMIASIETLLADQCERERLGTAAKRLYDARFDLRIVVQLLRNQGIV